MRYLVFPKVLVVGWVLDVYEHGFLNGPEMAVDLFVDYVELFCIHWVSCEGGWVMGP